MKYLRRIAPHGTNDEMSRLDTMLRECIGKTDGIAVGKASHNAILERERDAEGKNPEHYCRCCGIFLNRDGIGRCNDFLIFRNRKCRGPICLDCIKNRPDVWYQAYRKGLDRYNVLNKSLRNIHDSAEQVLKDLEKLTPKHKRK